MAIKQVIDAFDTLKKIDYVGLPVNALWREHIHRWRYLSDSYTGGNEYRSGEYLTKYVMEDTYEYANRLSNTALDNHCKSVLDTYNAFLFRVPPKRTYGSIDSDPGLEAFLTDADLEGRSFDNFMRDVSTQAGIYGHTWIICDKPATQVGTRAEELQQGIRPYVSIVTPENVINWEYERQPNGYYELSYLQVVESYSDQGVIYREYNREEIKLVETVKGEHYQHIVHESVPNAIGRVPAVCVYAERSQHRGIGISDLADISDVQREIYQTSSELEQVIRLSNHPSLVKTLGTDAQAGAGAIITMEEGMDPGLKPFLLQPTGASIESLLKTIDAKVDAINRMSNMTGVRTKISQAMSGVALETEFQLLNARLSSKADLLELAEEQIWRIWALWQGQVWDGEITYPNSFNISDKLNTVRLVQEAKKSQPQNPALLSELDRMLARALIDNEDDLADVLEDQIENSEAGVAMPEQSVSQTSPEEMTHPTQTSASGLVEHIKQMIAEGYSTQQILELHPELARLFDQT
jgi:hypothetical protein